MNREHRKVMKRLHLKRELRQAKLLFWKAEEKLAKLTVRINHKVPIIDKNWGRLYKLKELARLELAKYEDERKEAQYNWDVYKRLQSKKVKKAPKKKGKAKRR